MNHESDDAMFEALLAEAVGGPRPPDLAQKIVERLQAQPESAPLLDPPASSAVPRSASRDAGMASRDAGMAIVTPASIPRGGQRRSVLVCAWLASLAASVVLAGLFFSRPSEPLVRNDDSGSTEPQSELRQPAGDPSLAEPQEPAQVAAAAANGERVAGRTGGVERKAGEAGGEPLPVGPLPAGPLLAGPGASLAAAGDSEAGSPDFPLTRDSIPFSSDHVDSPSVLPRARMLDAAVAYPSPPEPLADEAIVARIDTLLRSAWQSAGIEPAAEVDAATWSGRLSQVLGSPVAVGASEPSRSGKGAGPSETIRRVLADPRGRQTVSRKFARTLLGRVGEGRLSEAQQEAFARWLSPAIGGEVGFDLIAAELLTARGSSAPEASDFNPASVWLSGLAGPRSVPLVEQFGHAMLDLDMRCGRCHDHPLDGRVWQNQYWEMNAIFQTSLRWSADQGRSLRVESVPPSARGADAVVFFELPDGRQRAVPPRMAWQWIAPSAKSGDAEQIARQAGELEGLAAALKNNPQLARAAVNRLWETVYGRPLIGSAADPSAPPESEALLQLQGELAEQLRAHRFDLGRALSWIAAALPMRLQTPAALSVERYELAADDELRAAGEQLRHYAGYPPQLPNREFSGLVAMVQRWSGDPTALAPRSDLLLGQLGENRQLGENGQPRNPKNPAANTPSKQAVRAANERAEERMLRAIYDSAAATAPVEWLDRIGTREAFDERALHLFYLAGYWNPSARQRAAAESLRVGADGDDAAALGRLWWVLSKEID